MTKGSEYTKRWRVKHPEARQRGNKRYYSKTLGGGNSGKLWTSDEDKQVLAHSIPDRELAALLSRSVKSIQVRRSRITNARTPETIKQ